MKKSWKVVPLAIVAALAACEDVGIEPDAGLDGEDIAQLAVQSDLVTGTLLSGQIAGAPPGADAAFGEATAAAGTREFHREHRCPAGGGVEVDGTIEKVEHGEGVVEFFIEGRGRQIDCAFERRRFTLTLNGEFALTAYRKLVDGEPVGPQTTTKAGWFEWIKTNQAGEVIDRGRCEYELTSVRHPDSRMREVTGHICGRRIDRSVDWDRRS